MVHAAADADVEPAPVPVPPDPEVERIEDLFEEVEDVPVDDDDEPLRTADPCAVPVDDVASPTSVSVNTALKDKTKFFSCSRCNYVTHLRARFTKHVKYHSMPMIKCTICDFRTPYKWNLDRHMKNHGGGGGFCCTMCNFTADIKQSLTVHEMNHHTPPVGHSSAGRRRSRPAVASALADVTPPHHDDDGSGDSRSSHSITVSVLLFGGVRGPRPHLGRDERVGRRVRTA
ncbi:RE1-silencing transcription factor [Eumeta japonica]|uniref:RE1-silencing transcription factor n=1 Tax=Eumeta variegata TaxID=151549 RepID=A0A4C1VGL4_EUMVA|nr:RE1-silencing transcription factor [Eumeta japonica]